MNLAAEQYRAIDIKMAQQIVAYEAQGPHLAELEQLVLQLSAALGQGQVCIAVEPSTAAWLADLQVVHHQKNSQIYANQPLVLAQNKLYLARYYFYEQNLLDNIRVRLQPQEVDLPKLQQALAVLFPTVQTEIQTKAQTKTLEIDWQKVAAASACLQNFNIITGGPGTGKTTTVTKLLSALLQLNPELHIALAAPTGKAAARMTESIRGAKQKLDNLLHGELIPEQSHTLHRLLGWTPRGFRYHQQQYLPYDCVVVDEASMIDLPMMSQLLDALAPSAKLILLGDKDQLASVEVGAVLADLCDAGVQHGPSAEFAQRLQQVTGFDLSAVVEAGDALLQNSVAQLRTSYRFGEHSGIGNIARAVNTGNIARAEECFAEYPDELTWLKLSADNLMLPNFQPWQQLISTGFTPFVEAVRSFVQGQLGAQQVFQEFNKFQLLVALRSGFFGVERVNQYVAQQLKPRLPSGKAGQGQWYNGRVVMISENNYDLNLFNGDIGIALEQNGQLRVAFESSAGEVRWLLPSRLPAHETAFAMTVHKSQGSEFEHVAFVLPTVHQPVVTKELIYTAITRAKSQFTLLSNNSCWQQGLALQVQRESGLRDVLWGAHPTKNGLFIGL